jgi:hypothetical protein
MTLQRCSFQLISVLVVTQTEEAHWLVVITVDEELPRMMEWRYLLHHLLRNVAVLMGSTFLEPCISMEIAVSPQMMERQPSYGIWQLNRVMLLLRTGFLCCAHILPDSCCFHVLHCFHRYSEGWGVRQDFHKVGFACMLTSVLFIPANRRDIGTP